MNTLKAILLITVLMISINCQDDTLRFLNTNSTEVHSDETHSEQKEAELREKLETSLKEYEKNLENFVTYKNDESAAHPFAPRNLVEACSNCWQIPKANLCGCIKNTDCCSKICISGICFDD